MQCHPKCRHPKYRHLILLIAALLVLPSAVACAETFEPSVVLDAGQPVYALVWDFFNLSYPGEELAYLAGDGSVTECIPGALAWQENPIVPAGNAIEGMWDRPTLDVGHVSGSHPHREIVVQAGRQLIVAHDTGASWDHEVLFDATGMTGNAWGARAGDYDPSHEGDEVFFIYEGVLDCSFGTVYSESAGAWRDTIVYSAEVGMDSAVGEFDSGHDGLEICLPTEMWPAYEILPPEPVLGGVSSAASPSGLRTGLIFETPAGPSGREVWPSSVMWFNHDHAAWVVKIGDVDPANPGNEVVYGTRYSNSITISRCFPGVGHELEVAFTGSAAGAFLDMWDIALGDVLPDTPQQEIVGVDDAGNVYLVYRNDAMEWVGETIWSAPTGALYAVVTCDVDDDVEGDEILVAGESGELTLLTRVATSVSGSDEPADQPGSPDSYPAVPDMLSVSPNPSRGAATIRLVLPMERDHGARVKLYNSRGQLVRTLVDEPRATGEREICWNGRDDSGRRVASGVYWCTLEYAEHRETEKFTLVR